MTPIMFPIDTAVEYEEYARQAQTGDIWVESGCGLISSRIKAHTDSEITHVGLILVIYGSRFLVESHAPNGVEAPRLLSDALRDSAANTRIAVYRWRDMPKNWYWSKRPIVRAALSHIARRTRYDYNEIARQARNTFREKLGMKEIAYDDNAELMCYEFVAACLADAGLQLPRGGNPASILTTQTLSLVCVLK